MVCNWRCAEFQETDNTLFNNRISRDRARELLYLLFAENPYPRPGVSVFAGFDAAGHRHLARSIQQTVHPAMRGLHKGLGDQVGADAVPGHEGQGRLEEIQPSKRWKLVEHHQQLMLAALGRISLQALGQAAADLVEHKPHQRLGAGDVGRGMTR